MVYETNSNNLIIENTSDGYIENIKLDGKTLINLLCDGFKTLDNYTKLNGTYIENDKSFVRFTMGKSNKEAFRKLEKTPLTPATDYTIIVEILENTIVDTGDYHVLYPVSNTPDTVFANLWGLTSSEATVGIHTKLISTKASFEGCTLSIRSYVRYIEGASGYITYRLMLLEGDHTQNPPNYFEGLKSVGEDVDKIMVSSLKSSGNLLHCEDFSITKNGVTLTYNSSNQEFTLNGTCVENNTNFYLKSTVHNRSLLGTYSGRLILLNPSMEGRFHVRFSDKTYSRSVSLHNNRLTDTTTYNNGDVITFSIRVDSGQTFNNDKFKVCFNKGDTSIPYEPYKEHRKEVLYKDVDGIWKKPILREWNTIEKHSDDKYYYHKRSGEVVLNGSENWSVKNDLPTDNPQGTHLVFYVQDEKFPIKVRPYDTSSIVWISDIIQPLSHSYGWNTSVEGLHFGTFYKSQGAKNCRYYMNIAKSKLSTQDVQGFKQWLQNNNVTVIYQLAQEEVYECLPIPVASYKGETTYKVESGVITPISTFELDYSFGNAVNRISDVKVFNNAMKDNIKANLTKIKEVL